MSHKQAERYGRVTGHTLRRGPQASRYTSQFVIQKRGHRMDEDDIHGNRRFQEFVTSDGNLQESADLVYSLNKQKRWELPGLLKESICTDVLKHDDLDFKVLLVEEHLDSHNVFKSACVGLYESKTACPERLPRGKYSKPWDLRKNNKNSVSNEAALRSFVNRLRCSKNRGGKKVNWRSVMDAMREELREEDQRREEEEQNTPQLHYEVGYGRPENKLPWRPEMKINTATSQRPKCTKRRHKGNNRDYMEDTCDFEKDIEEDILEEVQIYSEANCALDDSDMMGFHWARHDDCSAVTLGEVLSGTTKKCRKGKRRRRNKNFDSSVEEQKNIARNSASSSLVKMWPKGSVLYDPEGEIYKPKPNATHPGQAQASAAEKVPEEDLPSVCLKLDQESCEPAKLQLDFGRAYAEAECIPRKFAVQICDGNSDRFGNPERNMYALFEDITSTFVTEKPIEGLLESGVHTRLTVYSSRDKPCISSEQLAVVFPADAIFTTQDVMEFLLNELEISTASSNKTVNTRPRITHLTSDISTIREVLGWDFHFASADEAYRVITTNEWQESETNPQYGKVTYSECGICYQDLVPSPSEDQCMAAIALVQCGHTFCSLCWKEYVRSRVIKQGATDITCPEYNCKTPVDPVIIMAFVTPAQFHAHYRRSRDSALARAPFCYRCPNPLCGRIAYTHAGGAPTESEVNIAVTMVKCKCKWLWCTQCKEEGHWPASCEQAEKFREVLRKKLGEKDEPRITHVQVKRCPGCKTRWEKNGGCPSMICGRCCLNFCWKCLQPFTANHDYDSCAKALSNFEEIHLKYRIPTTDKMMEVALEHHKRRFKNTLKKEWFAAMTLAQRSAMVHMSHQRSAHFQTSILLAMNVTIATASNPNNQPVTWVRTKEDMELMNRRAEESLEIASFCLESNFVLEHMVFLLMGMRERRQRKMKWWRLMLRLRFIVQNLEETLGNLPNMKRSESAATMDRLCRMMHAGKECLRKLALSMSSTVS